MVVASLLTALPVAAQKETKDIDEWSNNDNFGKNNANLTADGYSLWDGQSMQYYGFNKDGDIEIYNAAQLARYAWDMYEANSYIRADRKRRNVHLLCDIDLGGYYFSILRKDYGMDRATFDGHGHTIRNGYAVESGSYHALFSYIEGSTIRDLVVKDYHLKDSGANYAGIVCSFARVKEIQFDVPNYRPGDSSAKEYGMYHYGCIIEGVRVIDCTLTGDATYAGGILGWARGSALIKYDERGGAIDYYFAPDKWKVQLCDNLVMNCTVSTTDNSAGGLVGSSEVLALYRNRVINTSIYGEDDYAGGLVGRSEEVINAVDNLVLNCNVSGDDWAAGAFGGLGTWGDNMSNKIIANIVHATVDGGTGDKAAFFVKCGSDEVYALRNYYNKDYSGSLPAFLDMGMYWQEWPEGKTTVEMLGMSVPYLGSDPSAFKTRTNLWPHLQANFNNDKVITKAAELVALAEEVNSGRQDYEGRVVRLGADIDMTGVSMKPIGTAEHPFMGEFNGLGRTISDLTINAQQDNVGLFGCLMNAYLHNVRIDGATVTGQNHVGVLFGTTVFSPCYISDVLVENSSVTGLGSVGGIGGRVADIKNIAYATFESCYFIGTVTTSYANANDAAWAGGICGNVLRGTITDCGCIATITRSTTGELKAGLIGGSNGTLEVNRCYATDLNNTRLALVDGRGSDAVVTETSCPETIAYRDGMKTDLGDNWFYFTVKNNLPIPANLGKYTTDDPTVIVGDLVFYPNNTNAASSYYVKEYIGTGGAVTIPATVNGKPVTKINTEVFCERSDVTSVTLQEGLQYIGNKAFYGTGITSLSLPGSITGLGDEAFAACPSLASISFGSGSTGVNSTTFNKLPNLASITVAAGNTSLKAIDDVLLSASGKYLYVCAPKGATKGDYTVPSGVEYVYTNAFAYCNQLTGITFPSSMVSSHDDLFIGCDNLRYVDYSQCTEWEQGGLFSDPGITVNRNPTAVERLNIFKSFPFAGLSAQTIIYLPADRRHDANGEKNVVIGNTGTDLVLTDGWDFDPKVAFSFPAVSYDRYFAAQQVATAEPQVDESGNPVYELDEHGEPVLEFVYDENGNHLYEEDGVTYKTQPVQAYNITESYEEKGYTVCLPFAWTLTLEENSEAKVYAPSEIADIEGVTTVTFSEVEGGQMEAYTPYYIVVSSGAATVAGQGGEVAQHQTAGTTVIDGASYQFKGSTATIPNTTLYDAQKPAYILQSDGIWYKVPSGQPRAYVGPFRAYFQATTPNGARSLAMMFSGSYTPDEGSGTTAIEPVVRTIDADGTERVFDLSGRRIDGAQKGIYIQNGKKYISK